MHKPLSSIMSNPKMYTETKKKLLNSINTFWNLKNCRTLREAIKTNCLPRLEQLKLIERKLAVPVYDYGILTANEHDANAVEKMDFCSNNQVGQANDSNSPRSSVEDLKLGSSTQGEGPTEQKWKPLDHQNNSFINYKKLSSNQPNRNIITENVGLVKEMSQVVKDRREIEPFKTFDQHEDFMMRDLRDRQKSRISSSTKSRLEKFYSIRRDESTDKLVVGTNPTAVVQNANALANRPRFTAYGHKTAQDSNTHKKLKGINHLMRANSCSINGSESSNLNCNQALDCNTVWTENMLHNAILKPTLPERDMKIPNDMKLHFPSIEIFDKTVPVSIILGGDKQMEEILRFKEKDYKDWKEKLISSPEWRFYRQNSGTEQKFKLGPEFQLDKLSGILKNEPVLNHLRKYPVNEIPALPVFDRVKMEK